MLLLWEQVDLELSQCFLLEAVLIPEAAVTPVVEAHQEQAVQDMEAHLRPRHYQKRDLVAVHLLLALLRLLILLVVVMIARLKVIRQGTIRQDREGQH